MTLSIPFRRVLVGAVALFSAAALQAQETIKIGALFSTSGPGAFLGVPEERGARLKVEQLNKAGGIGGRKVELVFYDTETNTGKAGQLARRLIESDQVLAIIGPSSSGESLQVLPIANESKIPLIAHAGTEKMTNPVTPWVFNTPPADRVVAAHMLSVFKKRGLTQIALLSATDGFGQSGANVLKELAPKYGVKIAPHEEFNRTDADMTAQVLKAKDSPAQAMLIWSSFPAPTIIARNAAALGYNKPMFNSYAAAGKELLAQAGPAAEGSYVSSMRLLAPDTLKANDPVRPAVMKIYNDYKAKYGEAPVTYVAHSHDALSLIEAAVLKIKGPVTRENLRAALETVTLTGGNGIYRLSPTSHGLDPDSNSMVLLRAHGGQWEATDE
ncbi:MAG: ABC transporter substrate-binding protein [Betaproteobacteria bacterium]|nr:ABC transporter substrate-binding protein [Betaproteobacteria bacterium]